MTEGVLLTFDSYQCSMGLNLDISPLFSWISDTEIWKSRQCDVIENFQAPIRNHWALFNDGVKSKIRLALSILRTPQAPVTPGTGVQSQTYCLEVRILEEFYKWIVLTFLDNSFFFPHTGRFESVSTIRNYSTFGSRLVPTWNSIKRLTKCQHDGC